ncbi:hypothetical protein BGW42_007633 [Actinomortierella wolfii]|nr:hypothetical protein BGW42_007633 [Actinomortierella wolfii]
MSKQDSFEASLQDESNSDTHMDSPAYSAQGEPSIPMTPQPKAFVSSGQKHKAPRDGYLYEPYDLDLFLDKDKNEDDSISAHQASQKRILELRGIEKRIVQLLETAGKAIQVLSNDDGTIPVDQLARASMTSPDVLRTSVENYGDERVKDFETLATAYTDLVNQIQVGMRRHFHYLTKAGIAASQVPFKNLLYGEERELETWLDAVDIISESTSDLIRKANTFLEETSSTSKQDTGTSEAIASS